MKKELETLRPFIIPLQEGEDGPMARNALRKGFREVTDLAIHEAILKSDLMMLAGTSAEVMYITATTLLTLQLDPQVEHFVYAAKELIEDARVVMDKGLQFNEPSDIMIAGVMIEIVLRGVCALIDIPYDDVFAEIHRSHTEGTPPDLLSVMQKVGHFKEPQI